MTECHINTWMPQAPSTGRKTNKKKTTQHFNTDRKEVKLLIPPFFVRISVSSPLQRDLTHFLDYLSVFRVPCGCSVMYNLLISWGFFAFKCPPTPRVFCRTFLRMNTWLFVSFEWLFFPSNPQNWYPVFLLPVDLKTLLRCLKFYIPLSVFSSVRLFQHALLLATHCSLFPVTTDLRLDWVGEQIR